MLSLAKRGISKNIKCLDVAAIEGVGLQNHKSWRMIYSGIKRIYILYREGRGGVI